MKKNFKLVLALVLSIMMIAGMIPAMAAAPTTGTITITNSADGTVTASTRNFKAYRILNATETFTGNDTDGYTVSGYAYTIPSDGVRTDLATYFHLTKGATETTEAFDQRIIDAIGNVTGASNIEAMAKALLKIAKDNSVDSVNLTGGTASDAIPFGYYVIEDTTSPVEDNVSAVMLDTNNPNVQIKVKATKPSLDKKIDEGSTEGRYDASDLEYDNHRIGDPVPYVMKTIIPDMTGYTKYIYIVQDTLSKGLAYNNNVVIKAYKAAYTDDQGVEHAETSRTLEAGTDYDVTPTTTTNGSAATDIEIVFKDFYNREKDHAGETLEITYSATVTEDAIIGVEGNPNTAKLIYSNNPNSTNIPDKDRPDDLTVFGETPDSKVITYVTGLKIRKVDPAGNVLSGATFELSGNLNKVEVYKADKFVVDADGTYFLLKDGKYTTTDPTTLDQNASNYAETLAKYVNPDGSVKYKKTTVTHTEKTAGGTPKTVSETTDANGVVIFDGMGVGDFTITETAAPVGYNKLKNPIEFTVNWNGPTDPTTSTDCTWTVTNKTTGYEVSWDPNANEFVITIENNNGAELPSTGGIGTTIFYIGGSVLVLAAAILLITKRRMSNND